RLFTKTSVERWARISSSRRGWMAGQMDGRGAAAAALPSTIAPSPPPATVPSRDMSSTGTSTRRSSALRAPASTISTGRGRHVRRLAHHARALGGGGVAGAQADGGRVERLAPALGRPGDADERRAQVALDVHGQRAQRGDVDDAAALALAGNGREHEPVDGGQ